MQISILKENDVNEQRVASTPDSIKLLERFKAEILIEAGAGTLSGYDDELYKLANARIVNRAECLNADICLCVKIPSQQDIKNMKPNAVLIGLLNPYENKSHFEVLKEKKITSCCMELIPRISRAQSMDVLSSQANLAGYKAVIDAAEKFKKAFPMMMTAAGTIIPAKCLILGAGVAGLQAIATAKRLGCVVSAFDVRPEVEEQVNSLGAKFIKVEEGSDKKTESVYAKEMSEEYKKKQLNKIHEIAQNMDIIISTALIPGKKAPLLIENRTIEKMKSGSILVDLATSAGGNIQGSELGKKINIFDKIVYSPINLPSLIANDASLLFAKNIFNFIKNFISTNKKFDIESTDELLLKTLLIRNGKKTEYFYEG